MAYPQNRPRRLRRNLSIRNLVSSNYLDPKNLVLPLFVKEGANEVTPIESMPGVVQHTLDSIVGEVKEAILRGVNSFSIFGLPLEKDEIGSQSINRKGIVQLTCSKLRDVFGDTIVLIPDLCLDEFTTHGHCGILDEFGNVNNDLTLEKYDLMAISLANAGADFVAPSGMMDGQVGSIRRALDAAKFQSCGILAYSVKYNSSLYGPFREAVNVKIASGGSRATYQQDIRRDHREAVEEALLDVDEGADIVMVKPAISNLDIIAKLRERINVPISAYQVSGEYSMIMAASERGWLSKEQLIIESLNSIKRSGASIIFTYFASECGEILNA